MIGEGSGSVLVEAMALGKNKHISHLPRFPLNSQHFCSTSRTEVVIWLGLDEIELASSRVCWAYATHSGPLCATNVILKMSLSSFFSCKVKVCCCCCFVILGIELRGVLPLSYIPSPFLFLFGNRVLLGCRESYYVAEAVLEPVILLYLDHRHAPPCLASAVFDV